MLFFINSFFLMLLSLSGTLIESSELNLSLKDNLPTHEVPFEEGKTRLSKNTNEFQDNTNKLKKLSLFGLANTFESLNITRLSKDSQYFRKSDCISSFVYKVNLPRSPPILS